MAVESFYEKEQKLSDALVMSVQDIIAGETYILICTSSFLQQEDMYPFVVTDVVDFKNYRIPIRYVDPFIENSNGSGVLDYYLSSHDLIFSDGQVVYRLFHYTDAVAEQLTVLQDEEKDLAHWIVFKYLFKRLKVQF